MNFRKFDNEDRDILIGVIIIMFAIIVGAFAAIYDERRTNKNSYDSINQQTSTICVLSDGTTIEGNPDVMECETITDVVEYELDGRIHVNKVTRIIVKLKEK